MPKPKLISHYGQFWERSKIFTVKDGRLGTNSQSLNWLDDDYEKRPPIARSGIYILYRGMTPVYVGMGTGKFGIFKRLQTHAQDWLAHAWDNVSWYVFDDEDKKARIAKIEAVEALLVATIPGLLNGAQPGLQRGTKKCFMKDAKTDVSNTLWMKNADGERKA